VEAVSEGRIKKEGPDRYDVRHIYHHVYTLVHGVELNVGFDIESKLFDQSQSPNSTLNV